MTKPNLFPCPDCGHKCSVAALLSCPNCGKPFLREWSNPDSTLPDAIHTHILSQSTSKVGMCLTLLGLLRVVESANQVSHFSDELLAVTAIGFLASGFFFIFCVKTNAGQPEAVVGPNKR